MINIFRRGTIPEDVDSSPFLLFFEEGKHVEEKW
jgi:hypothetical protein